MSAVLNLKENWRIYIELSYEVNMMKAVPYTDDIKKYLAADSVINYENEDIKKLSDALFEKVDDESHATFDGAIELFFGKEECIENLYQIEV